MSLLNNLSTPIIQPFFKFSRIWQSIKKKKKLKRKKKWRNAAGKFGK